MTEASHTQTSDTQIPNVKRTWLIGLLYVFSAQFLFGTTFAINKFVINQGIDPVLMGFNRAWIAIICLSPFYWTLRKTTRWTGSEWRRVIAVGALATAGAMMLEYLGTEYTTASNVSLIMATESVFSIFLAVLILKEKMQIPTLLGGMAALLGMTLVMWDNVRSFQIQGGHNLFGDLLVLGSVFCWGFYTINSKKILARSNPLVAHFYITLFCSISLGITVLLRGTGSQILAMSGNSWLGTIYLGSICSGLAMWLYFQALKRLPASLVALTLTLLPIFGVAFSMLLLNEELSIQQMIGGLAIILGVGYAVRPHDDHIPIPDEVPPGA